MSGNGRNGGVKSLFAPAIPVIELVGSGLEAAKRTQHSQLVYSFANNDELVRNFQVGLPGIAFLNTTLM